MSYIDITPDTSIIASWTNQLHQWSTIMGELIDNAFDADATSIVITFERNRFSIQDNGSGCADLGLMFKAGRNVKHPSTRLGRYGIGFKQAVCSSGRNVQVTSTHQGILSYGSVDWNAIIQSGVWQINLENPISTDQPNGTLISVSGLRNKEGLSRGSIHTLSKTLSEQYSPALKHGRQLILHAYGRQLLLQPPTLPELEHMRRIELLVGRKKANLEIGIVPEGVSYAPSALTVSYGFRVIQHNVRWGLGTEPTPGLVGWLELLDGWNLSTNKEKVLDEDLEALGKQISERCADIIARAVQRGYRVPVEEANALLNRMLLTMHGEQAQRKAKRKAPHNPTGTVTPKHTPRKHHTAARVQPGHTFLHHHETTGIKISLANLGIDGGLFNYQDGGILELNLDNPQIFAIRMQQRQLACIALMGLAANAILMPPGQLPMLFRGEGDGNLVEQMSQLANHMFWNLPALDESDLFAQEDDDA